MSESLNDLGAKDWYHGSDTEDDIPDPNLSQLHSSKKPINLPDRWKKDTFKGASSMLQL